MTEIPEHLLKRSKAAKSGALGTSDADDAGSSSEVTAAPAAVAAAPAAPAANLPNLDPEPEPPKPVPHFVAAAAARKKIPVWVLPVIAALPVWAWSFAGTMQQPESEDVLLIVGEETYASCAGCHGGNGGGGTGYALDGGSVLETFPEAIDMMVHVARGSDAILDQAYGAERADGQRVSGARGRGPMPAQLNSLDMYHLEAVIFHERAILSGEDTSSPGYQEWMEHIREGLESGDATPIDLDMLLRCANPEYTPGATGEGGDDCPGPHGAGDNEQAAG